MLNNIVSVLITVGGLGYINYTVAEGLNTIDVHKDAKTQAIAYSSLWSIVDFAIYMIVESLLTRWLSGNWLLVTTMLVTAIIAFIAAAFLTIPLHKIYYGILNYTLKNNQQSGVDSGSVWTNVMNNNDKPLMAYFYDFNHMPLGFGYVDTFSNDEVSNYSISLQPFNYSNAKEQDSYETMVKNSQSPSFREKYTVTQLVDLKQRFIMFAVQENS